MSKLDRRTVLGLAVAIALASGTASATNGYYTMGFGTKSNGMAGSGSADPQELMALATNPAGLAALPESVDAGIGFFSPSRSYKTSPSQANGACFGTQCTFTIGTTESGNNLSSENELFPIPFIAMNWKLDDQNALAAAFYARGGMNTQWQGGYATFDPDGWQGPAKPTTFPGTYGGGTGGAGVDLMQAFLNFTYAWKTSDDRFALGASAILALQSFQARGVAQFYPYTKTFVTSYMAGSPTIPQHLSGNGHDMSYGYGAEVGGIWNISRMFSVAAAYTSKIFMSDLNDYSDLFAESGGFDIPSTATFGLTVRPTDAIALNFDYQEIWYSDVPSVHNPIQYIYECPTAGMGGTDVEKCLGGNKGAGFGWEDMSIYKFGGSWKYSDDWTFRVGYSFADHQPIPKDQMTFNILAPGVIEQHYTAGFTHRMEGGNELNMSVMYAPTKSVKGPNNFDPTQTVEFSMHQFELDLSYSWGR